jgi:hypothetical protein
VANLKSQALSTQAKISNKRLRAWTYFLPLPLSHLAPVGAFFLLVVL